MRLFLQLIRKMTSVTHDGGTGRVVKGPPLDSRREFNHDDCRVTRRGFGKTGPRNLRGIENLRWRNTWETKGFRLAGCWRHITIN